MNNPSLHCLEMHPGEKQLNCNGLLKSLLGIKGYSRNKLVDLIKKCNSVSIIKFRIRSLEIRRLERLSVQINRIENANFDGVTFKIHYESQISVATRGLPSPLGHKVY